MPATSRNHLEALFSIYATALGPFHNQGIKLDSRPKSSIYGYYHTLSCARLICLLSARDQLWTDALIKCQKKRMQSHSGISLRPLRTFRSIFSEISSRGRFHLQIVNQFPPKRHALYNPLPKRAHCNSLQTAVRVGERLGVIDALADVGHQGDITPLLPLIPQRVGQS